MMRSLCAVHCFCAVSAVGGGGRGFWLFSFRITRKFITIFGVVFMSRKGGGGGIITPQKWGYNHGWVFKGGVFTILRGLSPPRRNRVH